jgi:hypothetical protein
MKRPEVAELSPPILDAVLSHRNLAQIVPRELLTFLVGIVQTKKDAEHFALFAHIAFDAIDAADMKRFFQQCPTAEISGALWATLAGSLRQSEGL